MIDRCWQLKNGKERKMEEKEGREGGRGGRIREGGEGRGSEMEY